MSGLRRDRFLFALLGVLILVTSALQPLSAAHAADLSGLGVICSGNSVSSGPSRGDHPSHEPGSADCPCCIGGACPTVTGPVKATLVDGSAGTLAAGGDVETAVFRPQNASPRPSPLRYPTPIRAPPLYA